MTSTVPPDGDGDPPGPGAGGPPYKIVVGGAAVSPAYAESIGADGTSSDAVGAARLVERLLAHQAGESPRTNP